MHAIHDTGYPHDGRADKDSYPHDGCADKDSYPHDRHNQMHYVKFIIVVASRPIDKSAGHWGETSSTGLARFGDWREYARAKLARQPLSCLSRCRR